MWLNIFPFLLIILGVTGVVLSLQGLVTNELPFIGRDDSYYLILKNGNEIIFWFLEVLYFVGGLAFMIFGKRQIRENKNILK